MKIFDKITHWSHVITEQCFYVMFILVILNIFLRYVFNINFIFMQELVMYMHAFVFLFGISICLKDDKHVRIDVVSNKLDEKILNKGIFNHGIVGRMDIYMTLHFFKFHFDIWRNSILMYVSIIWCVVLSCC